MGDLALDSVREQIGELLMALFNLDLNMPSGQDYLFPAGLTIQQVAAHIHRGSLDIGVLQNLHFDLIQHSVRSPYFIDAVNYVLNFGWFVRCFLLLFLFQFGLRKSREEGASQLRAE